MIRTNIDRQLCIKETSFPKKFESFAGHKKCRRKNDELESLRVAKHHPSRYF